MRLAITLRNSPRPLILDVPKQDLYELEQLLTSGADFLTYEPDVLIRVSEIALVQILLGEDE